MPTVQRLFSTPLYQAELPAAGLARRNRELADLCHQIAADDGAGQAWSQTHGYLGYTSYASLNDLPHRASLFADLADDLAPHVAAFARQCDFDLGRRRLPLTSMWINILEPGGIHSGHIHPHSAVSGTYYVQTPKGASAIKFEDPRLGLMMAAPPRRAAARLGNQTFVSVAPRSGTILLWESWLRHEVPFNGARSERISISFNYG